MSTHIQWTEETWNPVVGCSKVSEGCRNCYAIRGAHRLAGNPNPKIRSVYEGLTVIQNGAPNWTGTVRLIPERLEEPLRRRKPTTYFVNSMSDLFHESLPDEAIDQVFAVMALCPQHTFQVLTKRAKRMRGWFAKPKQPGWVWRQGYVQAAAKRLDPTYVMQDRDWPLPHVWLGVSVEDQATADERIPVLLQTPAAVRFVSYEPALGPVEFRPWLRGRGLFPPGKDTLPALDWLIIGGESGPGARPFDIAWVRSVIAQCRAAGVAVFCKQLGADPREEFHREGRYNCLHLHLKDPKGGDPSEWPEDLRVREMPQVPGV